MYGDLPRQETLEFHYRVLNYKEKSLAEIPFTGFSADYVYRETKRARDGAQGAEDACCGLESTSISQLRTGHSKCTPGGHPGRSIGGIPRRVRTVSSIPEILGDEAGRP